MDNDENSQTKTQRKRKGERKGTHTDGHRYRKRYRDIICVYIYVDKERGENIRWRLAELDRDKYKDDEDGDT